MVENLSMFHTGPFSPHSYPPIALMKDTIGNLIDPVVDITKKIVVVYDYDVQSAPDYSRADSIPMTVPPNTIPQSEMLPMVQVRPTLVTGTVPSISDSSRTFERVGGVFNITGRLMPNCSLSVPLPFPNVAGFSIGARYIVGHYDHGVLAEYSRIDSITTSAIYVCVKSFSDFTVFKDLSPVTKAVAYVDDEAVYTYNAAMQPSVDFDIEISYTSAPVSGDGARIVAGYDTGDGGQTLELNLPLSYKIRQKYVSDYQSKIGRVTYLFPDTCLAFNLRFQYWGRSSYLKLKYVKLWSTPDQVGSPSSPCSLVVDTGITTIRQGQRAFVTAVINKYKFSNDPNTIAFRKYSDIGLDYYNINTAMGNEGRQEFAGTDNSTNADVFTNYYYIKDHLGSTRMTLSGAGDLNFNRVEATMYESYGAMDPVIVSSTVNPAREKFTGKEFDKEGNENGGTGINLFYFGARYYDPEIGMWTSADKAGQFWNPYGYANNPIIMVDEDGNLFGIDDILIGIAVSMSINVISQGVSEATNENYKPNLGSFLASGLAGAVTGGFVGSTGLTSALGNALSGGTYQGATTAFNGGTFAQSARAFGLGFLGGAMIGGSAWAGGKIAQQDFAFSGLLGRGVASYGGTVARNLISGINGADAFNDLDINMWGIDLDFQNIGSRNADFNWSVDLGTIQGLYEINKAGGKWDWKSSLMSGSFVFRNAKGFPHVYGWGKGNAVTTTEWSEGVNETYGSRLPQIFQTRSVLAHEYMHTTASSFLPNITYNHLLYDYPIPWIIANTFNVYLGNPFESLPRLFQEY